jgi:hypothetical protein
MCNYYRGLDEVRHSSWFSDAHELVSRMQAIRCLGGATKIQRVLQHVRAEHAREKINAGVFVGDACEEPPKALYATAVELGVPLFVFQEGDNLAMPADQHGLPIIADTPLQKVETVFREIARLTNGAWARFDAGAAAKLAELLQAVAAFAVGGVNALADLRSESARKLLGQIRNE